MAITDRLRSLAGTVGRRLEAFSATAPKIDGVGITQQAPYPEPAEQVQRIINSRDALLGRISYGAGPMHTRYSTYVGTGLTPTLVYAVLRNADIGIMMQWADLCETVLERDGHLKAVDRARRVEVSGKPFRVSPSVNTQTGQTLATFVRAVTEQIDSLDRSFYQMLGANGIGYSLSEIVWAPSKVRIANGNGGNVVNGLFPRQLDWVHPKHARFERDTDEPKIDLGGGQVASLPPNKFVFHGASGDGLWERRGHMRACIWLHLFKQMAIRDWAIFGALFGLPNIVAKYPRGVLEPAEAQSIYTTFLTDYGQGKPIIIPDDLDVSLTPGPTGTGNSAQISMIGWASTEQSKCVLGETLTTELSASGVGSYNAAEVHAQTKNSVIVDDSRGLGSDIRTDLFRPIIEVNMDELVKLTGDSPDNIRGSVPLCSWRIEREVTPSQRASIFVQLSNAGLKIGVNQIYEEFGIDAPADGADILKGEPVSISGDAKSIGSVEASSGVSNPKAEEVAQLPAVNDQSVTTSNGAAT